jgi:hypothetical protein
LFAADPKCAETVDPVGKLPIHHAVEHQCDVSVIAGLLHVFPLSASIKDTDGKLPIHHCFESVVPIIDVTKWAYSTMHPPSPMHPFRPSPLIHLNDNGYMQYTPTPDDGSCHEDMYKEKKTSTEATAFLSFDHRSSSTTRFSVTLAVIKDQSTIIGRCSTKSDGDGSPRNGGRSSPPSPSPAGQNGRKSPSSPAGQTCPSDASTNSIGVCLVENAGFARPPVLFGSHRISWGIVDETGDDYKNTYFTCGGEVVFTAPRKLQV